MTAPAVAPGSILSAGGWNPRTRTWLDRRIRAGAGRHLPVAFDFDNTLVCGDIGEATLAWLVKNRQLDPETVARRTPPLPTAGRRRIGVDSLPDLTAYYEALLENASHGTDDPNPLSIGYVWAAEIMAGLTPAVVVRATAACAAGAHDGEVRFLEVTPGRTAYTLPWFYPEMVELVARLIEHTFDVWIVSASNVWSVRWMVLNRLNPGLARLGVANGIAPDHVIGLAPLLEDRRGQILKDRVLARSNPAYARLEPQALSGLRLTDRLDLPASVYSGKVACLWDSIGRPPYLAAGDSPGDLPMLEFAQNRLWIERIEKPAYTQALENMRGCHPARNSSWTRQPVATRACPGFLDRPPLPPKKGPRSCP